MVHSSQSTQQWTFSRQVAVLLILAGIAQALSLAWPFEGPFKGETQGWLQCLSLTVLAYNIEKTQSTLQAFTKAWLFSFAWLTASIWWLFISMNSYGGLSVFVAGLAVALMTSGLAIFYGAAAWVYRRVSRVGVGVIPRASAFAAVWTLAEMARGTLWTGFPWGAVGYAHVDSLLRHWAPWVGVYGLCALSAFFAMVFVADRGNHRSMSRPTKIIVLVTLALLGYTWLTSPSQTRNEAYLSATPLSVTLLQGNIAQDLKFGEGVNQALREYRDALIASKSDLTVTPETAIPLIQQQLPKHYWKELEAHFSKAEQAALIGMPLARGGEQGQMRYSNSVIALMPQTTPSSSVSYQYDKQHLVPFGEFVPPLFQWFVRMMNIPLGDFSRGDAAQPSLVFKGERIAPNICYEDLFGEEIANSFINPALAPSLMVNLSNIAWFGNTVAIEQHLNISRMRALEMGRPMLRATNTGATAIINAQGQVTHRLPSAVQGAISAQVFGVHGPVTPYAAWVSVYGLLPLAGVALMVVLIVAGMAHASRHGQRRFGP